MNPEEEVEPPQKKTKLLPLPPLHCVPFQSSFSSIPNEIVVSCFARLSKSYYPSLSLVSKTFRSLISSQELYAARSQIGTTETCLYIWLQFSTVSYTERSSPWFTLRLNHNRNLMDGRIKEKSSGNIFVLCLNPPPIYSNSTVTIGSDIYVIGGPMNGILEPSSAVRVYNCRTRTWRDLPNMKTERIHASACFFDDKIYVMGGCKAWCEDISWFEVFDIKTQTWKNLPAYPESKIRLGVHKINVVEGKIYVKTYSELSDGIYDVKEGKWSVADGNLRWLWSNAMCVIENVMYCYSFSTIIMWYDLEAKMWRDVKGLEALKKYRSLSTDYSNRMVELVNYGGKLAILWDRFKRPGRSYIKNIWCAVVALEKCNGGGIVGKIEWVDVVLTVNKSYNFLRCLTLSV